MKSSAEGMCGRAPAVEAYPFQGLDISTPSERRWFPDPKHPTYISLGRKYAGQLTPFGTPLADLARSDRLGLLMSKCGYCGQWLSRGLCRCHNGPTPNVDDFTLPFDDDARKPECAA